MDAVERWDGEAAPATRRVGHAPDDIPRDGDWYVMRSTDWLDATSSRDEKREHGQRIAQAVKYLRSRMHQHPGFEARKVREEGTEGEVRWHMLGRWTT